MACETQPPMAYMGLGGATKRAELISWPSHLAATLRVNERREHADVAAVARKVLLWEIAPLKRRFRRLPLYMHE